MEKIELNNKKRLMKYNKLSKEEIRHYLDDAIVKVNRLIEKVGNDGFLHTNSRNGLYPKALNDQWTNGFWTGIIWQMYLYTKNEKYFNIGKIHTKLFDQRASKGHDGLTNHDVGFLYSLSAVADYKITGDKYALDVALKATKVLAERFLPNVGVIQAWGKIGEDGVNKNRVIIDTNMNLPILYFIANEINDSKYSDIATSHLNKTIPCLIREDGTTYHTFHYDDNGNPLRPSTHQGKNDYSIWTRGLSWGIYGYPLIYKYNQERKDLIPLAKNILNAFLNRLPDDLVCPWDYDYECYDGVLKDAGTMPIVALGILEMIKYKEYFTEEEIQDYELIAHNILQVLIKNNYIAFENAPWEDGFVRHSVKSVYNEGINEFCLWGDYYYIELLMKLYNDKTVQFW